MDGFRGRIIRSYLANDDAFVDGCCPGAADLHRGMLPAALLKPPDDPDQLYRHNERPTGPGRSAGACGYDFIQA